MTGVYKSLWWGCWLSSVLMAAPLMAAEQTGEAIFQRECSACHGGGDGRPGTLQLGLTRGADKALLAERTDLSDEYVRYVVRHGLNSMPAFAPVGLTAPELDRLIAYLLEPGA